MRTKLAIEREIKKLVRIWESGILNEAGDDRAWEAACALYWVLKTKGYSSESSWLEKHFSDKAKP
jgi:hypothetical protein